MARLLSLPLPPAPIPTPIPGHHTGPGPSSPPKGPFPYRFVPNHPHHTHTYPDRGLCQSGLTTTSLTSPPAAPCSAPPPPSLCCCWNSQVQPFSPHVENSSLGRHSLGGVLEPHRPQDKACHHPSEPQCFPICKTETDRLLGGRDEMREHTGPARPWHLEAAAVLAWSSVSLSSFLFESSQHLAGAGS